VLVNMDEGRNWSSWPRCSSTWPGSLAGRPGGY